MGASFNAYTTKGNRREIEQEFKKLQEDDRYENGHSYSGGFGQCSGLHFDTTQGTFKDARRAEEWLADHADKWGPAIAVRYQDDKGLEGYVIGAWCAS